MLTQKTNLYFKEFGGIAYPKQKATKKQDVQQGQPFSQFCTIKTTITCAVIKPNSEIIPVYQM